MILLVMLLQKISPKIVAEVAPDGMNMIGLVFAFVSSSLYRAIDTGVPYIFQLF